VLRAAGKSLQPETKADFALAARRLLGQLVEQLVSAKSSKNVGE